MKIAQPGDVILERWRVIRLLEDTDQRAVLEAESVGEGAAVTLVQVPAPRDAASHVPTLARAWRALSVSGVARVIDLVVDDAHVFLAHEAVAGETLENVLLSRSPRAALDEPALLRLAADLCGVLEALHRSEVVCGDLGPESVVPGPPARVRWLDPVTALRALSRGRPVGVSVDVYGLGRVLYYAATRVTLPDLRHAMIDRSRPAPLHALNDSISAKTERAVDQMLRLEPSRRLSDLSAVRDRLGLEAPQEPSPAPEPPEALPVPARAEEKRSEAPRSPAPVEAVPVVPSAEAPPAAPLPEAPPAPAPTEVPPVPVSAELSTTLGEERSSRSGDSVDGRSRRARRISYSLHTVALLALLLTMSAWVARLLYGVTDQMRVRVDPRNRPPSPRGRVRVVAPRSPFPSTIMGGDGSVMLLVREGSFPRGVTDPNIDEGPQIAESLPSFYIDRTEVTAAQYARFSQATGWVSRGPWRRFVDPDAMDAPVVGVTLEDAEEYCRWVGKRLPTEEEWEKAARGSAGHVWPWGDALPSPQTAALFAVTSDTQAAPQGVGSCPQGSSACGALDMAGNVWEWTQSVYSPYSGSRAHEALFDKGMRVVRGGSWNTPLRLTRATTRMPMPARLWAPDLGFRCVLPGAR